MKKYKIFFFTAIICFLVSACVYDFVAPEPPIVIDPDDPNAVVVSFQGDIVPVFEAKCTSCHKVGGVRPTPDLTANNAFSSINTSKYINAANPEGSLIYTKPNPGGNHPGKYSTNEATLVLGWIIQGAKNN